MSELSPANADLLELGSRLADAVQAAGGKSHISRVSGVSLSSLDRYTKGASEPGVLSARALASACRVSLEWLITGLENAVLTADDASDLDGYVLVPRLGVRASAGPGITAGGDDSVPRGHLAFLKQFLTKLGIAERNAQLLDIGGDSMYPTLWDGDTVLIDRAYQRPAHDDMYVLTFDDRVSVKRIQKSWDGSLLLSSDNKAYNDLKVPLSEVNNLVIEGRVRWFARVL